MAGASGYRPRLLRDQDAVHRRLLIIFITILIYISLSSPSDLLPLPFECLSPLPTIKKRHQSILTHALSHQDGFNSLITSKYVFPDRLGLALLRHQSYKAWYGFP